MTTGRINQVTIVRRGWPTGAAEGAGEISSYWWRLREARRAQRLRRVAGVRRGRQSAFPLFVPQGIRPPH